jgi:hypothetical protein
MAWFKIDDHFWSHPKTGDLSDAATALWIRAGSWSAGHLTDGFVPSGKLRLFRARQRSIDELVEVGLWEEVGVRPESAAREAGGRRVRGRREADGSPAGGAEHGYLFHDWADYQPSREAVTARRDATKNRVDAWRNRNRNGVTTPDGNADVTHHANESVTPPPSRPDPTRPDPSSKEEVERPAKRGSRLSPTWLPSPESIEKIRQEAPGVDPKAEHSMFVDYWIAQPGQKGVKTDWDATWRNWMRRKQADLKAGRKPKDQQVIDILEQGRQMQAMEDRRAIG